MANPFIKPQSATPLGSDWQTEDRQLEYQRRLAEKMAEDNQPPQGGMVGSIYVPPAWTQMLAKALNPVLAQNRIKSLDEKQRGLAESRMTERMGTLDKFSKALTGTPENMAGRQYVAGNNPDEESGMGYQPAVAGDRNAALGTLAQSRDPMLQQMYMAQALKGLEVPKAEAFTLGEGQVRFGPDGKQIANVAPKPQKQEKPFIRTRVMGDQEVQEQLQADGSYQEIGRGPRFARQVAPVVNVGAGTNKPPVGYRVTASGDLEAIPGGPADVKAQAVAQRQADGATDVDVALGTLRDAYGRLEKGGGITSTANGPLSNAAASLSSSAVGQATGKLFGTGNQSARNDIAMARPALLAALMKATGMSAKQMDSNAELKLWLSTATDPTLDVESNRRALENIERKYIKPGMKASPAAAPAAGSGSNVDDLLKKYGG